MELGIYPGIKINVEGLEGERISQMCQCIGTQSWCGGDRRTDWVWAKQPPGKCYGELNGHLPWQLQPQFKFMLQNKNSAFVEYWLALALTTILENSGNFDPVSKFVQMINTASTLALQVRGVGNIVGCEHVIPEIASGSKTRAGPNERWIVNSHIDLVTGNDVYN